MVTSLSEPQGIHLGVGRSSVVWEKGRGLGCRFREGSVACTTGCVGAITYNPKGEPQLPVPVLPPAGGGWDLPLN